MNQLASELSAILRAADQLGGSAELQKIVKVLFVYLHRHSDFGTHELGVAMLHLLAQASVTCSDPGARLLIKDLACCVREFKYEQLK